LGKCFKMNEKKGPEGKELKKEKTRPGDQNEKAGNDKIDGLILKKKVWKIAPKIGDENI